MTEFGELVSSAVNSNGFTVKQYRPIGSSHITFVEYYPNGNKFYTYRLRNREWHGLVMGWYSNGNLMEKGTYCNGERNGLFELYDESGTLESIVLYAGCEEIFRIEAPRGFKIDVPLLQRIHYHSFQQ